MVDGLEWIWKLKDQITKPLEGIIKLDERLREGIKSTERAQTMAHTTWSNQITQETAMLRQLQGSRAAAYATGDVTAFNQTVASTGSTFSATASKIQTEAAATSKSIGGISMSLNGMLRGMILISGITIGAQFIGDSIKGFDEAQKAQAQLKASLESTRNIAGKTFQELTSNASKLQGITLFDDDSIVNAQSVLLTFTNIRGTVFDEAIPAIMDMSTKMGTDLQSSVMQVGKALNDPIEGLSALRRVGVAFTDDQEKMIKKLVETGKTQEAQTMILTELNKEFGGSAKAAAESGLGGWQKFKNQIGELQESLGELITSLADILMPVFQALLEILMPIVDWLNEHKEAVKNLIIVIGIVTAVMWAWRAAMAIGAAIQAVTMAIKSFTIVQWLLNIALTANPIGLIIVAIGILIGIVALLIKHWQDVIEWLKKFANIFLTLIGPVGWVIKFIINHFKEIWAVIRDIGIKIGAFFKKMFDPIKNFITGIVDWMRGTFGGFFDWVMKLIDKLIKPFKWIVRQVKKLFGGGSSDDETSPDTNTSTGVDDPAGTNKPDDLLKYGNDSANDPIKDGINSVGSGSGKSEVTNKTINIGSLIQSLNINHSGANISDSEWVAKIKQALVGIINDTEAATS